MFEPDIIIEGGAFGKPSLLKGLLSTRMNIVYGRNGSGKSTIARAFREQTPEWVASGRGRSFRLSHDGSGSLDPEECKHTFVFNEDFIDDNVKFQGGLRPIVRIGSSARLDGPIQEAKDRIRGYRDQQKPLLDELEILNAGPSKAGSVEEAESNMKKGLKADGGFISRLSKMEGRPRKLMENMVSSVSNYDAKDTLPTSFGEFAVDLDRSIDRYLSFQSGTLISWQRPSDLPLPDLNEVNGLLSQIVRPANLTEEEQRIFDELSNALAAEDFLTKTRDLIVESDRGFCPLCHQPITDEYRYALGKKLVRYRDDLMDAFKERISTVVAGMDVISVTLPALPTSDYDSDLKDADVKLQKLNDYISQVKDSLEKKSSNTSQAIDGFAEADMKALESEFCAALDSLAKDVETYNKTLAEKDHLRHDIEERNNRLAYHENKTWIDAYNSRRARASELNTKVQILERKIAAENDRISQLNSQVDQVDDARTQINSYLDIIFGPKRMRLQPDGKNYRLEVKKGDTYEALPPKAISSGERNALALAYFFACVLEKKVSNYNYDDPTLLVIDDPVSSFDAENKAGVISLVASQCEKILAGNTASKVLVMTHDYTTLKSLCDLRETRITPDIEYEFYISLTPRHQLRFVNCSNIRENLEYSDMFNEVYVFARFHDPDSFDKINEIGNTIRKFAESYATRMYKSSWVSLFNRKEHLQCLPPSCVDTVRTFAVRNVLNSESHGASDDFEPGEIQRSARMLLTYIRYADPRHLEVYLKGWEKKDEIPIDVIDGWME